MDKLLRSGLIGFEIHARNNTEALRVKFIREFEPERRGEQPPRGTGDMAKEVHLGSDGGEKEGSKRNEEGQTSEVHEVAKLSEERDVTSSEAQEVTSSEERASEGEGKSSRDVRKIGRDQRPAAKKGTKDEEQDEEDSSALHPINWESLMSGDDENESKSRVSYVSVVPDSPPGGKDPRRPGNSASSDEQEWGAERLGVDCCSLRQLGSAPPAIVIDAGSSTCKVGFAGCAKPTAVFATAVVCNEPGRALSSSYSIPPSPYDNSKKGKRSTSTDRANAQRQRMALTFAVKRGLVVDWEAMERIWRHAFTSELAVDPAEHALLLTEPPIHPKASRGRCWPLR
jgi:actin-like protein 6A